jgi:hypothetical protein
MSKLDFAIPEVLSRSPPYRSSSGVLSVLEFTPETIHR